MTITVTKRGAVSKLRAFLYSSSISSTSLRTAFTVAVAIAVTAGMAYAQEHGGGHGEEGATMLDWGKRVLNFTIIAAGLGYIYSKYIKGSLKGRIESIESALAEAKSAREEALKRLADVEARLKDKDSELAGLISVAEENGRKEKALLIEEGARMAEDIIASAKDNLDSELIKAKEELRREAALVALELAEKMVRENITKEDRTRIVEEYIAKVGG